uniref:Uncharacterized protein n=1 Tax=Caenorhabditis japonica TaxID=281687 RepID=A0A8R1E9B9_CAEJA
TTPNKGVKSALKSSALISSSAELVSPFAGAPEDMCPPTSKMKHIAVDDRFKHPSYHCSLSEPHINVVSADKILPLSDPNRQETVDCPSPHETRASESSEPPLMNNAETRAVSPPPNTHAALDENQQLIHTAELPVTSPTRASDETEEEEIPGLTLTEFLLESAPEMSVLAYEQPDDTYSLPFLLIPMGDKPPLIALADSGAMCSLFTCAAAVDRGLPVVATKKTRFNGITGSQTIDAPVYHVQLGDRSNTEIFVKGFPGLNVKIQAPSFSKEDALALTHHGIDPRMLADLQARHGQLADLIVGQDILPSLYRDTKTFLLPSGRRIEKTPLGVITHSDPLAERVP